MILNICFSAEERRRMLHEIEYRDAEVARQVQTRLFKDTGTPPLPMMSNGDVPEAVGGKVYLLFVSSVVEFYRWWVLKCKILAQESTCSKDFFLKQSYNPSIRDR